MKMSKKFLYRASKMLKYNDLAMKMSNLPGLKQLGAATLDAKNTRLSYIPIVTNIEVPAGTPLPTSIVEQFINNASHHFSLNDCPCRTGRECDDYPRDFGCTFLGEAVLGINPELGKLITREEAIEKYHKANELGLITCAGKFKGDALALGVAKNHKKLMTICHCCPCHCVSNGLHFAPKDLRDTMARLDGLTVEVTDDCTACGKCVDICIFKAMTMDGKKAVVNLDECKGCGRCAMVCKKDAVRITIDNPEYVQDYINQISALCEVR